MIAPPKPDEYAPFYANYVKLAKGKSDVIKTLAQLKESTYAFLSVIPPDKADYTYAPSKWTVKQLVNHITDAERIFAYRLLRFCRQDATELAGFDENVYVERTNLQNRTIQSLAEEFKVVRTANLYLVNSLVEEQLSFKGMASNQPVSVRALLFIMAGHELHHLNILQERYL